MDDYIVPDPNDVTSWRASTLLLQCPERCSNRYDPNDGAPQFLLLREHQADGVLESSSYAPTASWLRRLKCPRCGCYWAICIECISNRTSFRSQKQVRRHWTRNHGYNQEREHKRLRMMTDAMADHNDLQNYATNCQYDDDPHAKRIPNEAALVTFPFSGSHNVAYFQQDHVDLGVAFLVAKSQFGSTEASVANDLLKEDVSFQLNLASFLGSITRGQQHQFAEIMCQYNRLQQLKLGNDAEQQIPKNGNGQLCRTSNDDIAAITKPASTMPQWFSRMPMSFSDLRKVYIEGKNSFLPNLPRPPVQSLNLHDYVSLSDCVADILAHGLELDDIREGIGGISPTSDLPVTNTSKTKRAREIYDNGQQMHSRQRGHRLLLDDQCLPPSCLYLCITEWSDAFQPSSSIKARNSVWVKTVTISATSDKVHSLLFTYPIAVGEDGACHDEVEVRFAAELAQLSSDNGRLFYHGGLKTNVRVYAEIFASLMDQPERRKSNAVLLGGSSFTARWRTCANFASIASKVKACKRCFEKLLNNIITSEHDEQCPDCSCWRTENCGDMLQSDPPAGYPTDVLPAHGKLVPYVMNYHTLLAAVDTTHTKILQGLWTKDKAHTYLRVHGVNKKSASEVIDNASNCRKLASAAQGTLAHTALALEAERHPSMYKKWKPPAFWNRNVPMERFVDAPMHLLFLGITKTIVTMIHEWLRLRDQNTIFLRYARKAMLLPYKLGLDWCKAIPYGGGKLGGYIAENYLAIGRLSGWFYSVLPSMIGRPPRIRINDPTEDVDKATWTIPQLRKWLFNRGLPNHGHRHILMVRITACYDDQGLPPPVIIPPMLPQEPQHTNAIRGGPVWNTQFCVSALQCMLSRLMKKSVTEQLALDCERHIFIFLSYFDEFDKRVRDHTKQPPTWISSYNFLSLLNLPDVMRMYGPLRNLWEGGGQGEKVLTIVKPTWCGFRKSWRLNMLDRMLRRMAIDRMRAKAQHLNETVELGDNNDGEEAVAILVESGVEEDEQANTQSPNGRNFIIYRSDTRVRSAIQERAAISVVRVASGEFGCIINPTQWLELKPTRTTLKVLTADDDNDGERGRDTCKFFYWTASTNGLSRIPCSDNGIQQPITNYCMLLPKLNKEGDPSIVQDEVEDPQMIDGDHDGESGVYTLIDSNWDVLHDKQEEQDMTWIISPPKVSHAKY
jgi:hypothetical protein